jgi:hypothetical protein
MSSTVDQRIVEMRFDNSNFEQNVSNTMSTLDKFKHSLKLDGASQGLENVQSAARQTEITATQAGFSLRDVWLKVSSTFEEQVANKIISSATNIAKALTIQPITTGFNEYEMKMDSIKTIVNSTGRDLPDVNRLLEELNAYSDQTIYSFKDMTQNIGKFTNAGVNLEDAVLAIKGISNEAAVSGASAEEASRAMYNFSQALSSGFVKLIDWKSIENANMATVEFKQQLIDTAVELGVVSKAGDMYTTSAGNSFSATKNFNDVLQDQWMTTDVLIKTLGNYADENTAIGKKAFAAAQEVTKLTQMWDILQETAQSGWAKTWEIIVGDLESAKALFTPLTNFFSNLIATIDDARNRILEIALNFSKPWSSIAEKLKGIFDNTGLNKFGDLAKGVGKLTHSLEYYQDVVTRVWRGDYKNHGDNPDRFDTLTEEGYNWRVVQSLVNLGYGYKLTLEDIIAAEKKYGVALKEANVPTKHQAITIDQLNDLRLEELGLTEEEIRLYRAMEKEANRLGISIEQLAADMSKADGRSMLIESLKNIGDIFVGIGKAAKEAWVNIFNPPSVEETGIRLYGLIASLKEFTKSLRFTDAETGELNETGLKFQRIFKGIFAIVDIVTTVIGGPLKLALKLTAKVLGYFGIGIIDLAAIIADVVVKFHDWFESVFDIAGALDKVVPWIKNAAKSVGEWFEAFKASDGVQKAIDYFYGVIDATREWFSALRNGAMTPEEIAQGIVDAFTNIPKIISAIFNHIKSGFSSTFNGFGESSIGEFIKTLRSKLSFAGQVFAELGKILLEKLNKVLSKHGLEEISADSIAGFVNGLKEGISKVLSAGLELAKRLIEKVKEFLGIHSPSKVFYAIGGFIIAGLIAGLRNGIPDSLGAVKDVFQPMLDWLNAIDLGSVVAGIVGVGTVKAAGTAAGALADFAAPFAGVGEILASTAVFITRMTGPIKKVVKGFAQIERSVAFNIRMEGVATLIKSIVLLVGAIAVLTLLDTTKLWNAVGIVAALSLILVGLAFAMNKLNSGLTSFNFKEGLSLKSMSAGLIGIGAAVLLIALAVKAMGNLDPEQAKQGFLGLAGIIVAMAAIIVAFGLFVKGKAAQNVDKFGAMMLKMSVALLLLVMVTKRAGKLDGGDFLRAAGVLAMFLAFMALVTLITKIPHKNIDKFGTLMLKMSVALLLMVTVAKQAGKLDENDFKKGALVLGGVLVFLTLVNVIALIPSKNVDKLGGMLLSISVALLIMIVVVKLMSKLTVGELIKGLVGVALFGAVITLMVKSIMKQGSQAPKVALTILAFSFAIALIAAVAVVCGMMKLGNLIKGVAAVSVLAVMMSLMIKATKDSKLVIGNIIALTVAIGLMAAAVAVLSFIKPGKLALATGALAALMGMFALLVKLAGKAQSGMGVIISLAATITIMGGLLYLLSTLPIESTLGSAAALGGLMLAMAGVLAIMIPIGKQASSALKGVGVLAVLGLSLLAFVLVFAVMQNIQNAIVNAQALTLLVSAMALMLLPLSLVGAFATAALTGVLVLTAMAVPLLAFIGIIALMSGIKNGMDNIYALIDMMTTIGDLLIKISLVAPLAVVGVVALSALVGLMTALGVVATAIGALVNKFPQLQTFLDTGLPILEQLAGGLGTIIGAFISNLAGEIMSILPQIGTSLSEFMTNATPFIEGMQKVDASVLTGAGIMSAAIIAMTAADLISGISSFIQGGSSLADLGTELSQFMINALPFIAIASTMRPETVSGVKALAETILLITAADILEGLTSWLTGGSSLEKFAEQLPILGAGLAAFSSSLGAFTDEQVATVSCAASAVKKLAQASSEIPNSGGLIAAIVGNNDLGTFADQFPNLGLGLRQFVDHIGVFTDEQVATVNCAAEAIKSIAEASSEIPNSGGFIAAFVGNNDLGPFADQFPNLGAGLRGFLDNVKTFSDEQVATVNCAAEAIKSLAEASSKIPNSGGFVAAFVGNNDLGTFADQFPNLGAGLRGFLDNAGTIDETANATIAAGADAVSKLAAVADTIPKEGGWFSSIFGDNTLGQFAENFPALGTGLSGFIDNIGSFSDAQVIIIDTAIRAVDSLTSLANADLKGAVKHLEDFSDELPNFAKKISKFCSNMPSTDSTNSAISNLNAILSAVESISNANSGCLATFAKNLKKVGEDAVKKFIEAFTSKSAKTDLKDAAEKLSNKAVSGAKKNKDDMKSAGKDLGSGLVKGIKAKWEDAYDAGYTLGQKAVQGEKDGQQSKSPSKLTTLAGEWLGEGLIIGIGNMARGVYNAGSDLGQTAAGTISSAVSKIASLVDTDIDSQPTIRPVLDLSDVKSGVASINSMFGNGATVGVMANVNSISSTMADRSQNGANDDVISAIDRLRRDLGNVGNTSYTINGVTYDDGSNIADAVKVITRAAIRERRV